MLRLNALVLVVGFAALGLSAASTVASIPARSVGAQEALLTPFQRQKTETLLRTRLPCLGCHAIDDEGGRIGPDLSEVGSRRTLDEIASIVANPRGTFPATVMPAAPMPESWRELVVRYLAERGAGAAGGAPVAAPAAPAAAADGDPAALYGRQCATCHGASGGGDGPNAPYLPVTPTVHSDSAAMSLRPDDSLFDAIYAGGYIMGRSPFMPAFGESLTREQIRGLVGHIRTLCRCLGPAWSRDGIR